MQACGEIACHFQCCVVEPRIVVFYEDDCIVQAFLCAEGVSIFEIDTITLSDCLIVLMAAYYVFDVQYPSVWKPSLLFFQEILMEKETRPIRYTIPTWKNLVFDLLLYNYISYVLFYCVQWTFHSNGILQYHSDIVKRWWITIHTEQVRKIEVFLVHLVGLREINKV